MSRKFIEDSTKDIDDTFDQIVNAYEKLYDGFDEVMTMKEEGELTIPNLRHLKKKLDDLEHNLGVFRQEYGI
jgi:uncharacterized protein Yka (UPF0111/DUF47 family)